MSDRFLPYSRQDISKEDIDAVCEVLQSDWITQGPSIRAFEEAIADKVGAKYAVAVANGTVALHIACLVAEVGEGDEVITTPNTFVASSNAAFYCGAMPVFADINQETGLISVDDIQTKFTSQTKAIIPVDFAGCPADMSEIYALAQQKGCRVIQDACHSLGATYKDSVVGDCQYADMTIFSFHPVKPMTTGEGGVITTNDEALYERLCLLRSHGITKENLQASQSPGPWYYEMQALGFNYRITDIQAALGLSQLKRLDTFISSRQKIAAYYDRAFKDVAHVQPLNIAQDRRSGYHLYVLLIDFEVIGSTRADVMQLLREKGIGSQVHYIPVHTQPYYRENGFEGVVLPQVESYYERALSIPIFQSMTTAECERVVRGIKDCVS